MLALLYLWADRFIGGGMGWQKLGHDHGGPLRGGPGPYAFAVLTLAGWFTGGWPFVIAAVAWSTWRRVFGWKLAGHSAMTPGPGEWEYALVRHSYLAVLLAAAHAFNLVPISFVYAGVVHAIWATVVGRLLADKIISNNLAEMIRSLPFAILIVL